MTEVTRRRIFDALRLHNLQWAGSLGDVEFPQRIYALDQLPSGDSRFSPPKATSSSSGSTTATGLGSVLGMPMLVHFEGVVPLVVVPALVIGHLVGSGRGLRPDPLVHHPVDLPWIIEVEIRVDAEDHILELPRTGDRLPAPADAHQPMVFTGAGRGDNHGKVLVTLGYGRCPHDCSCFSTSEAPLPRDHRSPVGAP
ncbi:hypothetical protein [Kitasatospora sp. NPDC098663]|uniref:AbiJ-related protein n=1 Tax=Kitasatospora sp. NPDC098663 TaxID=3364096 RepID=UPI003809957A